MMKKCSYSADLVYMGNAHLIGWIIFKLAAAAISSGHFVSQYDQFWFVKCGGLFKQSLIFILSSAMDSLFWVI